MKIDVLHVVPLDGVGFTSIKTVDRAPTYGMYWKDTDTDEEVGRAMRAFINIVHKKTEKKR